MTTRPRHSLYVHINEERLENSQTRGWYCTQWPRRGLNMWKTMYSIKNKITCTWSRTIHYYKMLPSCHNIILLLRRLTCLSNNLYLYLCGANFILFSTEYKLYLNVDVTSHFYVGKFLLSKKGTNKYKEMQWCKSTIFLSQKALNIS